MIQQRLARSTARALRLQSLRSGSVLTAAPLALAALGALAWSQSPSKAPSTSAPTGQAAAAKSVDLPKDAVGAYDLDPGHSTIAFKIKHLGVAYQLGRFDRFSGEVKLGAQPGETSVRVTLDPATVNSNNQQRDEHLRSQDFLDAKQFPEAAFTSTAIVAKDADTFTVTGELELHGVKKSVSFDMDFLGAADKGARMGFKAGFYGQLTINRRDFGMTTYDDDVLSNQIELTLAIECNKRK